MIVRSPAGSRPPSFVPPARRPAVRRRAALALTAVLGVGGCTGPKPVQTPTGPPSVSVPPSVSAPPDDKATAEAKAVEAYRGMWKAYAKAGLTANPDEPDLAVYATDPALKLLRDGLAGYQAKGQVFKGEYGSTPSAVEATPAAAPTTVIIADCLDSTNFLVYKASGEKADDIPGGRRSTSATVKSQGGVWRVTSFAVREKGTC
ncbi:hypothetical protein KRMM14A1259_47060 [Krasilnikovia sp. MM14-A1259]